MTIKAVLFDYSGVLTTPLNPPTGDDAPFDVDALFVEMAAALAGTENHPWRELERGEISLDDYCTYIEGKVAGTSIMFAADSEHNVVRGLDVIDDRLALAAELKASGLRTALVTNNVAEWKPLWRPGIPDGVFDVIIDSADVGVRKPEPEIYQLALAELGIGDPAAALFIDDFEWNVTGATDIGMAGLHCTADMDLRAAVQALLD